MSTEKLAAARLVEEMREVIRQANTMAANAEVLLRESVFVIERATAAMAALEKWLKIQHQIEAN